MKTLSERLNFSHKKTTHEAVKIFKWHNTNLFETLCYYCSVMEIDLKEVTDEDFDSSVSILANHGQNDKEHDHYYFWIDAEK